MMEKISKRDIYRDYKEHYPKGVNYKTYCTVLNSYIKHFIEDLFTGRTMTTLIGKFYLVKKITKKPILDYKEYNTTGNKVFYFNEHTKNYKVFLKWLKPKNTDRSRLPYRITPVRAFAREIAKRIKENPSLINDYEFHKY